MNKYHVSLRRPVGSVLRMSRKVYICLVWLANEWPFRWSCCHCSSSFQAKFGLPGML